VTMGLGLMNRAMPGASPRLLGWSLVFSMALLVAARRWLIRVEVDGVSMQPALRDGDRVLALRLGTHFVERGSVVVARPPSPWAELAERSTNCGRPGTGWVIKRVAGRPGDPTPQVTLPGAQGPDGVIAKGPVPRGHYYLLGDAQACEDSRVWGYVPADRIVGPVIMALGHGSRRDHATKRREDSA
jgi:signal peptidase I